MPIRNIAKPCATARFKHPFDWASVAPLRAKPGDPDMKALLSKEVGGPETLVLENVPAPAAKPGFAVADVAAAFIMTPGTRWLAPKDRANLPPGQPLLVLGAAGGVGLAAGELGKAM